MSYLKFILKYGRLCETHRTYSPTPKLSYRKSNTRPKQSPGISFKVWSEETVHVSSRINSIPVTVTSQLHWIRHFQIFTPPVISLLVTLHYFASGAHYVIIGDRHGFSKSSVSRAIVRTSAAKCALRDKYVRFPSHNEVPTLQREFYNITSKYISFPCTWLGPL